VVNISGWLVVNHYVKLDKFNEIFKWLERAAARRNITLTRKTNEELMCVLKPGGVLSSAPDFVLFWDKDTRLARYLESLGLRLFNKSAAIEVCDDKSLTHLKLQNLKMPITMIAPKTYDKVGYDDYTFLDKAADELGFPMIVKECFGSFGWQVYLAKNMEELRAIVDKIGVKPMLFQEFIASSRGRDIRISIVGGKPVAAMLRYSTNGDFRANVDGGAKVEAYTPDAAQTEMAVRAANELGLDFCGVDILFGRDGEPILCEVNSNAQFQGTYDSTGVNIADHIMEHIINS
jgi:RimK family alpha-L-glutamate ligase